MSQIARGLPVVESDGCVMPLPACYGSLIGPVGNDDLMRQLSSQRQKKGRRGFLVAVLSWLSALNLVAAPARPLPPLEFAHRIRAETNAAACELRRVLTLASARYLNRFTEMRSLVWPGESIELLNPTH